MARILLACLLALSIGACAYNDITLSLSYTPSEPTRGLISGAPQRKISVGRIVDLRPEKRGVGYNTNLYGEVTALILSEPSVNDLFYDTVATVLSNNNHIVVEEEDALRLSVELNDFWLDYKSKAFAVDYFGVITARLLLESASSQILYDEEISVYYSEETAMSGSVLERVMNGALADFGQKVQNSSALTQALIDYE